MINPLYRSSSLFGGPRLMYSHCHICHFYYPHFTICYLTYSQLASHVILPDEYKRFFFQYHLQSPFYPMITLLSTPPFHPCLTSRSSSANFEPDNFLLREPYSFLAKLVFSFSCGVWVKFGSGMSPMNRRIISQIPRDNWEGRKEEGGEEEKGG